MVSKGQSPSAALPLPHAPALGRRTAQEGKGPHASAEKKLERGQHHSAAPKRGVESGRGQGWLLASRKHSWPDSTSLTSERGMTASLATEPPARERASGPTADSKEHGETYQDLKLNIPEMS